MAKLHLVFYGHHSDAAKALAAQIRLRLREGANVRQAGAFTGAREACEAVILLPDVEPFDKARLLAAYGDKVKEDAAAVAFPSGAEATSTPGSRGSADNGAGAAPTQKAAAEMSDEELRAAIKDKSGQAPHPATGRAKLLARYAELTAAAQV